MKEYIVIYEKGLASWGAYVPDLPGCFGVADTLDELQPLMKEAIEFHIRGLQKDGDPIPEPTCHVGQVAVAA